MAAEVFFDCFDKD